MCYRWPATAQLAAGWSAPAAALRVVEENKARRTPGGRRHRDVRIQAVKTTLMNDSCSERDAWLGRLDSLGILLSGLCIVHCLALPLLLSLLPLFGESIFGGHGFHEMLLLFVVPLSLVALGFGYRRHHDARVLVYGATGLALLAFATYGYKLIGLSENAERSLSVIGGLIHAAGHVLNFRLTRALHDHSLHTSV
jgi:hypothetical protein